MKTIKEILKLDLNEDIKSVIDLEDKSQDEIQSEIESYIVTDGLGKHFMDFVTLFSSNNKETGVWISGFYGSGKSYFGKMLGYLIENPVINGTSAQERFIPRLEGVKNQSLIENAIRKLGSINSRVIFLDIAKQNTDNGLAFTLFLNFLKSLGFREDLYGYMEYELFIDDKYDSFKEKSKELLQKDWEVIKKSNREISRATRRIYTSMDYTEKEFEDTLSTYSEAIKNFDAGKLKTELEKYLLKITDEKIVFIFDEASEAISQNKFNILDLEGLVESLSSIRDKNNKIWTVAIAQEELGNIIKNTNTSKNDLNKLNDRFEPIALEATEVDVIIRKRLLLKKDKAFQELKEYYQANEGSISDSTNLKSSFPTKTVSAEQFATYYPFHKYQFDLLQKFLFSSKALVATQIAARGMIITTFDVLRKELRDRELYKFTTAHDLCTEAQTAPPAELVNKYSIAKSILENSKIDLDGELLLKSLHLLSESELVSPTVENITKVYLDNISKYYDVKPYVEEALNLLVESKLLLLTNSNYKITSDLEGKLLEEMKDYDVEIFTKKRELVGYLKKLSLFRQVSEINEDSVVYKFNILTDLDDEIIGSNNKNLRLTVYSLFNINDERQNFIEGLKLDTQYTKELITLIPDNSRFAEIDSLLEEVKRYGYMEEKYANDYDADKRQIVSNFSIIKEGKEKELVNLIESAYYNGSIIYLFDENLLNNDNFKGSINEIQRKLIKNIYTKRLSSQLSEAVVPNLLKETNDEKLHRFFSGDEFKFFDTKGNFVGDHLKVIEEISNRIKLKYIDGRSLEDEFLAPPWGYSYGTISTVLAVLFRAGRLVIRLNDTEFFDYKDKSTHEVFTSSIKFKNARFKSISETLTTSEKNTIIQSLLELDYEQYTDEKLDWKASDFDVANAISKLAEKFISSIKTLLDTQVDFEKLFTKAVDMKDDLQIFSGRITEANYIDKAKTFLENKDEYTSAVRIIIKTEKFIKRNLDKLKAFDRFVKAVNNELVKAGVEDDRISLNTKAFNEAMSKDVIEQFADIQNAAQSIKDAYYELMSTNASTMKLAYENLQKAIQSAQKDLTSNYPVDLNDENTLKLNKLMEYCAKKVIDGVRLEYQIECQDSKFSLSDIINYIALAPSKEAELELIKGSFVKQAPKTLTPGQPKQPKKMQLGIAKKVMTAGEYRKLLAAQIQAMAGMSDDDEVEVTVNN